MPSAERTRLLRVTDASAVARQSSYQGTQTDATATTGPRRQRHSSSAVAYRNPSPSQLSAALLMSGWHPAPGVPILFRDVSVVEDAVLCEQLRGLCCRRKRRVLVRHATGLFSAGGLHVIVALERASGTALLESLIGRRTTASGQVWLGSQLFLPAAMQHLIGVVWEHSWAFPEFTVEDNLRFGCQMQLADTVENINGRVSAMLEMMRLAANWKVANLSKYQRLRLDLGMELVADPPVLVVGDLLECLDVHETIDCIDLLSFIARSLDKTVIVSSTSIPVTLFQKASTMLVIGCDGHALFSGTTQNATHFFSSNAASTAVVSESLHPSRAPTPATSGVSMATIAGTLRAQISDTPCEISDKGVAEQYRSGTPTLRRRGDDSVVHTERNDAGEDDHAESTTTGESLTRPALLRTSMPVAARDVDGSTIMDIVERLATDEMRTAEVASRFYDGEYRGALIADQQQLLCAMPANAPVTGLTQLAAIGNHNPAAFMHPTTTLSPRAAAPTPIATYDAAELSRHTATLVRALPPSRPLTQFLLLLKMTVMQSARQIEFYIIWALLFAILGVCVYMLNTQLANQAGLQNRTGIIFLLFLLSIGVNGLFVDQWYRESRRYVHLRARGLTHPISHLGIFAVQVALQRGLYLATFTLFVYVTLGRGTTATSSLLGLTSYSHALIVFAFVLILRSARLATAITHVFDVYTIVFCGYLINITTIGPFFSKTSLVRFGYGAAVEHELRGGNFSCFVPLSLNVTSPCYTGDQYLAMEGFQGDTVETASQTLLLVAGCAFVVCLVRMWTL